MNTKKPDVIIVGHIGTGCMSATDILVERLKTINAGVVVVSPEKERGVTITVNEKVIPFTAREHQPLIHIGPYKDGQANRRERRKQNRKK